MNNLRERRSVSIDDFSPSLTEQAHKNQCDIHRIIGKYKKSGLMTHVNAMEGKYADYPNSLDFQLMQVKIATAKSMFETIPSHIRAKFKNDVGQFLDYVTNPENRQEMIELGFKPEHLPDEVVAEPQPEPEPEPAPEPEPPAP